MLHRNFAFRQCVQLHLDSGEESGGPIATINDHRYIIPYKVFFEITQCDATSKNFCTCTRVYNMYVRAPVVRSLG